MSTKASAEVRAQHFAQLQSLRRFHGFKPFQKRERSIDTPLLAGADEPPRVVSRRDATFKFEVAGAPPVDDVVGMCGTIPVTMPSRRSMELTHDIARLLAELHDVQKANNSKA
jgi:hypothetical protein